jgi:hypothetical protein
MYKFIAAALTAVMTVSTASVNVPILTGNRHWQGPKHCVTREPYVRGVGWVEAQACIDADIYTWWDDSLVGGTEVAQTNVLGWVQAWHWSAPEGRWVGLQASYTKLVVAEVSGDQVNVTRDHCRGIYCPLKGLTRAAVLFHRENIHLFADCNTYHWHGTLNATMYLPGIGPIFNGYRISIPATGGAVAAIVCSP